MDAFTRAYITCALWLLDETPGSGEWSEHEPYTLENVAPETLARMTADCQKFRDENAEDLNASGLTVGRMASNFWLNRNGHGSGFWDEGEDTCFERLSEASHKFGEYDLYFGDDGRIYGM